MTKKSEAIEKLDTVASTEKAAKSDPAPTKTDFDVQQEIIKQLQSISQSLENVKRGIPNNLSQNQASQVNVDSIKNCNCKSTKCCCFEVYISRMRVIEDQSHLPPKLTDESSDGGFLSQYMELIVHAIVDGRSGVHPGLNSHIQISQQSGWVSINKLVTKITVSGAKSIPIMVEAREVETRRLSGLPEHGSSTEVYMALACGCPVVPVQLPITLSGGGKAGGRIEVELGAREVCCDLC